MRSKDVVTKNLEQLRYDITNIKYLYNTSGNFQDMGKAFEKAFERLENVESLISIEPDDFRTNQII